MVQIKSGGKVMFDCHVHSNFSTDGKMSMDTACRASIKAGLSGISFTDHLDFDYPGYEDGFLINFDEYFKCIEQVRGEYGNHLKIVAGLEAGIQPHTMERTNEVIKSYNFDYVIGSVHIIDGVDPYYGEYYGGKSIHAAYSRYLEEVFFMVREFDNFDILGHFDYIIRYAPYDDISMRYKDYADLFDAILKNLIDKGKGIEINTASYKGNAEFDIDILRRYRQLGGELVCLGSDAHSDVYLGHKFDYFRQILISAGFKNIVVFKNRKPEFISIIK